MFLTANFLTTMTDRELYGYLNSSVAFFTSNSTSRYLDDLLNIDNPYFEEMVNQIFPPELQLNKANTSDTEVPFFLAVRQGLTSVLTYI